MLLWYNKRISALCGSASGEVMVTKQLGVFVSYEMAVTTELWPGREERESSVALGEVFPGDLILL